MTSPLSAAALAAVLASLAANGAVPRGAPPVGPVANWPQAGAGEESAEPRFYLERGTHQRAARPEDDLPDVCFALAELLRDDRVPGFYDGQFASTAGRFDELVRVAQDRDIHHTMRMMAVMALQEAGDGEALAAALQPLLMDPEIEFQIEDMAAKAGPMGDVDPERLQQELDADLSRHARYALAKDGQPEAILAKIRVMERYVLDPRRRVAILDPNIESSDRWFTVGRWREIWFDIGYHYQQFDDFESASRWFRDLCDHLTGIDTRWAHYNLACIAAIEGRLDEAVTELEAAADAGFLDVGWMDEDGDLEFLRGHPGYEALRARLGGAPRPANSGDDGRGEDSGDGA